MLNSWLQICCTLKSTAPFVRRDFEETDETIQDLSSLIVRVFPAWQRKAGVSD